MLVSIVIPCYNQGEYLDDALRSISAVQVDYQYEIIIVNDGSTDINTINIIDALDATRVQVINQQNQGLAAARNNGIRQSKGKYIIPLDSDNKLDKGYLVDAIAVIEANSTIDVVYGNPLFFGDESGVRIIGGFKPQNLFLSNYIDACAVFKREIWEKTNGYDGQMPYMGNEDWELWIHIFLLGGTFYYLDKVCFHYRVLGNSMSVTTTRPGYKANKEYIFSKHSKKILDFMVQYISSTSIEIENRHSYYNQNKLRTAVKLLLGRSL